MTPSDRQRIVADHKELRALLSVVEDAAERVQAREPGAMTHLRIGVRDLDMAFRAHLTFEESVLFPILPVLTLTRLRAEHAQQRTMLTALTGDVEYDVREPTRLAEDAIWLTEALTADMNVEDHALGHS
jgi:hypothetical protein